MDVTGFKRCSACGEWHPKFEFWKDKSRYDGVYPYCKICSKEGRRENNENKFKDKVNEIAGCILETIDNKEGEELPSERDNALFIGVSRTQYREVMCILQFLGFVKVMHGKRRVLVKPIVLPLDVPR